ncbi:protein bric-a-brac 2 [Trichonephila clavata]|uniref:Protein bric-a-brac 2 n=1 Tax=Trichonephila clavata TaxID=2740835 RepID=A0A8X6GTA6_TRICU|nr:protein bric-a-brac 2 [Trichonephila clavata]
MTKSDELSTGDSAPEKHLQEEEYANYTNNNKKIRHKLLSLVLAVFLFFISRYAILVNEKVSENILLNQTYIFVLTSHCLILICATMSQQFCLKWNNHTNNMIQVFESLLSSETLVDVTLACDGLSLKAHKLVLSACSTFFQSLFLENPCKHPIVIMKDMRYSDLKAIIDFMYRGEVNVSHDQLAALLKTAETLKVKGLAEVTSENRHAAGIVQQEILTTSATTPAAQRTDTPPLQGKRKRGRPRKRSLSDSNRSDDEGVAIKIKERDSPEIEELSGDASMEATSDIRSGGLPNSSNSQSQVPSHSSNNVNSFSKSHLSISQDPLVEEPASGDEPEFEVEPSKLLEQTLTTDNVPSNSQNSTGHVILPSVSGLEISRRSMSSTDSVSQAVVPASDSLGSNIQGPDSPQDIKPQILSFDDPPISPVAGTSHGSERSMMMYMDQSGVASIPGPSNYQDNSALVPHDSQPQGEVEKCCEVTFQVVKLYGGINEPVYRNFKQQLCGK